MNDYGTHMCPECNRNTPKQSASTEVPIPGTCLSFVVKNVCYADGKVTIETLLLMNERSEEKKGLSKLVTTTILEDSYTLSLGKDTAALAAGREPIHMCSHEH